jgi:sulfane dehydrogenase subunit SoxC
VLYGERSAFVKSVRVIDQSADDPHGHGPHGPAPNPYRPSARTPVRDSIGIITPSSLHFTTQHLYGIPVIDPANHRLLIHGLVDRPLTFTMDDLMRFPSVSRILFVECRSNQPNAAGKTVNETHGRMACSEWTGVPLALLLHEAGVQKDGTWIVAEGSEGGKHQKSVPMGKVMEDVLVAYGQNGEPIRPDNGFPLRLVVPGYEGINQVKWLHRIQVVDRPYLTYQEQTLYISPDPRSRRFIYELGPKSVITYPSGDHRLSGPGFYTISGLAWSGGGAVRTAEVSTDNGRTWHEATLQAPVLSRAHTRFTFPWRWNGEEAVIMSRCIDELGQRQPTVEEFKTFWTGRPNTVIRGTTTYGHMNQIQPWKVNRDGRVENAYPA